MLPLIPQRQEDVPSSPLRGKQSDVAIVRAASTEASRRQFSVKPFLSAVPLRS